MDSPGDVGFELDGWSLFWARLARVDGGHAALANLRVVVVEQARERFQIETLASEPAVAGLRALFRAAGSDPTRYRPSSEALIRRVLKGNELPAISPLVDINNCLSLSLGVPCCVMDEQTISPPFVMRAGSEGESYESLRGPFNLESRPLLADSVGVCDAPITGSQRVKVTPKTQVAWLVAYLPQGVVSAEEAGRTLEQLLRSAPVANATNVLSYPETE